MSDIYDLLYQYWGYSSFREKQEEIILSVLSGKDTLALLPTGGGKSLTFQIPALVLGGMTIVVTPLISLMKDQVDNLHDRNIPAAFIHSGLKYGEIRKVLDKCIYGHCKLLYISPERLSSPSFVEAMKHMPVSLIAVDEAHCISQWGYDFRPSYLKISLIRDIFPDVPFLALTASATPAVVNDIMEQLNFRERNVIKKSFRRNNISYIVRYQENKADKLYSALAATFGSCIIYVRSRAKARQIAQEIVQWGFSADFYHAGLSNEEKKDKQDRWKSGEIRIIVATNAFGMGIDKPDVRLVIHLDVPNSLEEYYQEAGRAGRDGKRSYALLLVASKDRGVLNRRISEAFPNKDFIKDVYERLCDFFELRLGGGFDKMFDFNLKLFSTTFGFPELQTYNALKILSGCQYINYLDEVDTLSRIMILVDKTELYQVPGMTQEMDEVLEIILRNYSGFFSEYVFIDEAAISYRYHIPPQLIYDTLLFLNRSHIIHYIPRKRTAYIYFPSSRIERRHIEISKDVYEKGKEQLKNRISAMLDYAYNMDVCREAAILNYFEEKAVESCGHCDVCVSLKNKSPFNKGLFEGIFYMLSIRPRTLKDFADNLSYSQKEIADMLRILADERRIKMAGNLFLMN